jgi:hypothetical protein
MDEIELLRSFPPGEVTPSAAARTAARERLLAHMGGRLDPSTASRFLKTAARIGRYDGLAAAFGRSDRQRLLAQITASVSRRVAHLEKPLQARASRAAQVLVQARVDEADALTDVTALNNRYETLVARREELCREVDAAAATLPDPPAAAPTTAQDLLDEQKDAEPVYSPTLATKGPQRLIETALDFVTFYPLLAGAALGSELLGPTGSRLLVLVVAVAASLAVPIGACRLGEMTVEGSLLDPHGTRLARIGFGAMLCVPVVTSGARALQVLERDSGTPAGAAGVFTLALMMWGIVVLEFTQGRRAAIGVLVESRRRVAGQQRDRRRNPPPPPEPQSLVALRARLHHAEQQLAECKRELATKRTLLTSALKNREAARLELREISVEAERMARSERALGQQVATEALRARAALLSRVNGHIGEDLPDADLVSKMPTPPVLDPYALIADVQR